MKYTVYTLEHPITNDIRYVGKTNNTSKRYSAHLKDKTKSPKTCWIKSLLSNNLKPLLQIIEEFDTIEEVNIAEQYYIEQFKSWGFKLTNLLKGGEGGSIAGKKRIRKDFSYKPKYDSRIITKEVIIEIVKNLLLGLSIVEITKKLNVGKGLVESIRNGKTWREVTTELNYTTRKQSNTRGRPRKNIK